MNHLRVVLQLHKENRLFTKYNNCEFWLRSVEFFGHTISSEGVEVNPWKTKELKNWPRPLTPIDIRSFYGSTGLLSEVCGFFCI